MKKIYFAWQFSGPSRKKELKTILFKNTLVIKIFLPPVLVDDSYASPLVKWLDTKLLKWLDNKKIPCDKRKWGWT